MDAVPVEFCPTPYTFADVPGFTTLWKAPELSHKGVYLWCIEHGEAYLINYVGKAAGQGGFKARLEQEYADWEKNLYVEPVDLDLFLAGRRKVLEPDDPEAHAREGPQRRALLRTKYRFFLAPIGREELISDVEGYIVKTLRQDPATRDFLCNKRLPKSPAIDFNIAPTVPLIGLTSPVPKSLR